MQPKAKLHGFATTAMRFDHAAVSLVEGPACDISVSIRSCPILIWPQMFASLTGKPYRNAISRLLAQSVVPSFSAKSVDSIASQNHSEPFWHQVVMFVQSHYIYIQILYNYIYIYTFVKINFERSFKKKGTNIYSAHSYGNVLPRKWVVTQVPATRPDTATRPAGSGWPEQCPPMQAAAAFGWASDLNPVRWYDFLCWDIKGEGCPNDTSRIYIVITKDDSVPACCAFSKWHGVLVCGYVLRCDVHTFLVVDS